MDKLLIQLLESLLLAQKKGADVGSTDVREEMFSVIWQGFLKPTSPLSMPRKFYFEQQIHEDMVNTALQTYIDKAVPLAEKLGLSSFKQRLLAFQGKGIETPSGVTCDRFFGWIPAEAFDEDGNAVDRPTPSRPTKKRAIKKRAVKKRPKD